MMTYAAQNATLRMNGHEVPVAGWRVDPGVIGLDPTDFVFAPTITSTVTVDDSEPLGIEAFRTNITLTTPGVPNPTTSHKFARHPHNRRWRRREAYYLKTAMSTTWTFPNAVVTKSGDGEIEFTVYPTAKE